MPTGTRRQQTRCLASLLERRHSLERRDCGRRKAGGELRDGPCHRCNHAQVTVRPAVHRQATFFLHLLVEAENKLALARGMQGFQISMARNINTALGPDTYRRRRGPVFADRYHLVVITSPPHARNALSYLLINWRKHQEDRGREARGWLVDPFSSGFSFPDWRELEDGDVMWKIPEDRKAYEPLIVYRPRSWLLERGWKLAGSISVREVPSKRP